MTDKNQETEPSFLEVLVQVIPVVLKTALVFFLSWLIPGAGHVYIGRRKRGIILFVTIAATFWAGVAMGGVMTVDSRYEPWWFAAQSITGIHGMVGWYRQEKVYKALPVDPENPSGSGHTGRPGPEQMTVDYQLQRKGLALTTPTEGIVRAYTGVAGMLNLLCIFDAVMLCIIGLCEEPARQERGKPARQEQEKI